MKQVNGWWVPDVDTYMEFYNGDSPMPIEEWVTQALTHVTDFSVAVVAHARVGYMLGPLVSAFTAVHAFEPVPTLKEALDQNVTDFGWTNVTTYSSVLINTNTGGFVVDWDAVHATDGRSEEIYIKPPDGSGTVQANELDFFFPDRVGFLYIDSLGAEYYTLVGSKQSQWLGPDPHPVTMVKYYDDDVIQARFGSLDPDLVSVWNWDFLDFYGMVEVERFDSYKVYDNL